MTTVVMFFILPIGIIVYFWDRKNYAGIIRQFSEHIVQITNLPYENSQKLDTIEMMFHKNNYATVDRSETTLVVEKKHFNLGVPFIFFGLLAYLGLVLYLVYFYYLLKPRRLKIDIGKEPFLSEGKRGRFFDDL